AWFDPGDADAPARLTDRHLRCTTLDFALKAAIESAQVSGFAGRLRSLFAGSTGRVVVAVSDPGRWSDFTPLDVDARLKSARPSEVVIDRVALDPKARAAVVTVEAPLGLNAARTANQSPASLVVVVKSPELAALASAGANTVDLALEGRLD